MVPIGVGLESESESEPSSLPEKGSVCEGDDGELVESSSEALTDDWEVLASGIGDGLAKVKSLGYAMSQVKTCSTLISEPARLCIRKL